MCRPVIHLLPLLCMGSRTAFIFISVSRSLSVCVLSPCLCLCLCLSLDSHTICRPFTARPLISILRWTGSVNNKDQLFVTARIGSSALIPCNLTLKQVPEDFVTLVLWYKDDMGGAPIFTIDARTRALGSAPRVPSHEIADRASFDLSSNPAVLRISPLTKQDDGLYKCRVDYRRGRTVSTTTYLSVVGKKRKDENMSLSVSALQSLSPCYTVCLSLEGSGTGCGSLSRRRLPLFSRRILISNPLRLLIRALFHVLCSKVKLA